LAERYGYINRALPADEITPFVERLAYQIASLPKESLALTNESVNNAFEMPIVEGLLEETHLFVRAAAMPEAKRRMNRALELGFQTREPELDLPKHYGLIAEEE
jgi:enoyl-CoA hydratase/carnithine racemase